MAADRERIAHTWEDDRAALTVIETLAAEVETSARHPVQVSIGGVIAGRSVTLTEAQIVDLRDTLTTVLVRQYGHAPISAR